MEISWQAMPVTEHNKIIACQENSPKNQWKVHERSADSPLTESPPSGGVVRRAAELSAEWRSCPPRRSCPPAELSASGPFRWTGGLFWRTSPRVRRGPRRVRSESNGVRDFPADSWRTLSGLGGVRSGGLEGGVRSESNGVQWSPLGVRSDKGPPRILPNLLHIALLLF